MRVCLGRKGDVFSNGLGKNSDDFNYVKRAFQVIFKRSQHNLYIRVWWRGSVNNGFLQKQNTNLYEQGRVWHRKAMKKCRPFTGERYRKVVFLD